MPGVKVRSPRRAQSQWLSEVTDCGVDPWEKAEGWRSLGGHVTRLLLSLA